MSCSPFDLRDYFLKELAANERRQVESHVRACEACREELDRLRMTEAALLTLRDEEIPQRIGFVSDKVFEPSPLRRWWQAFLGSSARLGFASAAMLSAAIIFSTLNRPAPLQVSLPAPAARVDLARTDAAISRRIDEAVRKAVAESEVRQEKKTAALLAASERRNELDRKAILLAAEENFEVLQKRFNRLILASNDFGAAK